MDNTIVSNEKMHRGQPIRDKVKEEIKNIPRGNAPQNELRMFYWPLRMNSLGKKSKTPKTREAVLIEAINEVKKTYPDFKPKYDKEFFKTEEDMINP
jgi:hypothetical protein